MTGLASATSLTSSIASDDGMPLLLRRWPATSDSWAQMLLVHGLAEHSGRYERSGRLLAEAGIDVTAFELRGHGGSGVARGRRALDGLSRRHCRPARGRARRGGWPSSCPVRPLVRWPDQYRLRAVRSARAGPARAVGTCARRRVAALAARPRPADRPDLADARPQERVGTGRAVPRSGGRTAGAAGPWQPRADDGSVRRVRVRGAGTREGGAGDAAVPTLVFHGSDDRLVPPTATEPFEGLPGVAQRVYPGLRHETLNGRKVRRSLPTSSRGCATRSIGSEASLRKPIPTQSLICESTASG